MSKLSLLLGHPMSPDRMVAIGEILFRKGFTTAQLDACFELLNTDPELAKEVRYGGTITPSTFTEARKKTGTRRQYHQGDPKLIAAWEKNPPGFIPPRPKPKELPAKREPVEYGPPCGVHPKHRTTPSGVCAVCLVEEAKAQIESNQPNPLEDDLSESD